MSHCKQVMQLAACHSPALLRRVSIECLMSYNISICLCNIIYRQHSSTWELTEGRQDKADHVTSESIKLHMCCVEPQHQYWWGSDLMNYMTFLRPPSLVSSCLLKKYPLSGEQRWSPECNTGGVIILKIWRLKEHLLRAECGALNIIMIAALLPRTITPSHSPMTKPTTYPRT